MTAWASVIGVVAIVTVSVGAAALAQTDTEGPAGATESRLGVVWTSGDPDVAHRMCLMYTHAARKSNWFDHVRLVVWGPSARLLATDAAVEAKVKAMMADGVEVQACIACADSYGVSDELRQMGIEVKGMGRPLTDMLKDDWHVLTF